MLQTMPKSNLCQHIMSCCDVEMIWRESSTISVQFWLHMNTYMYMTIWEYLSKLMFASDDKIWIKGNKMRSENYVYFWTNPFIKLYTLCMADIVMLYSSLCRSAGAMAGDSLGPGSALGKRQKTGYSKKKMASKTSRGMVSSLRSPFFSPFLPTFL